MHTTTNHFDRRLLRMKQVQDMTGLSRSYLYALSASGKFPKSIPLVPGGTSRAWLESDIVQWIDQRIAERDLETCAQNTLAIQNKHPHEITNGQQQ